MKRYSLGAFDPITKREALLGVGINDSGKYIINDNKSLLSTIDLYTTNFTGEKELLYDLLDIGVIDRDAKLSIRYENNGPKKTTILYQNDEKILPFAEEMATNVSMRTEHFNKLLNQLLKASSNKVYLDYMYKYGYINDYLYNKLNEYSNNSILPYEKLQNLTTKIAISLSSYKSIRDIYIGTKRFKNKEMKNNTENVSSITFKKDDLLTEDEQYMLDLYLNGGEDALYSIFDQEQVSEKVYKKINNYHKKGL